MPDSRQHRGPHPQDRQLFAEAIVPQLVAATGDLSWLLTRGYASTSSLKLVGDRYALDARQRVAVARCACAESDRARRLQHHVPDNLLAGSEFWIDGYNLLTTIEAALSGGVILQGCDGTYRDMASMHGSYRKVTETMPAVERIGEWCQHALVGRCRWFLDQPVSNSGRLKAILESTANQRGWNWQVELVPDPDPLLSACQAIVVSADSQILNRAERWFNLARQLIREKLPQAWVIDLST